MWGKEHMGWGEFWPSIIVGGGGSNYTTMQAKERIRQDTKYDKEIVLLLRILDL